MRHWQPLLRRYKTALKTSYKSTVVGFVRLRTDSSNGQICANCSGLISLGYGFLCFIPQNYRSQQAFGNNYLDDPGRSGPKIVNRLSERPVTEQRSTLLSGKIKSYVFPI